MAVLIGYFNGIMVVKSGLPSFIVTLAMLFILRGATLAITRLITGRTQVPGLRVLIEDDPIAWIFATDTFQWPLKSISGKYPRYWIIFYQYS